MTDQNGENGVMVPPPAPPIFRRSPSKINDPADDIMELETSPVKGPGMFSAGAENLVELVPDLPFNLEDFTYRLAFCVNQKHPNPDIYPYEVNSVIKLVTESFKSQEVFLRLTPPIKVCGDIHGQFPDLLRIFKHCGFPPRTNYLFLGDYIDRGKYSVETILLLFCYKILYPHNFFLLRGNHEAEEINRVYGFFDECNRKFQLLGPGIYKEFQEAFNWMPVSALIDDKILCMHGGLSPEISTLDKNWDVIQNIRRPTLVPSEGILCDLLWADPRSHPGFRYNETRKISFSFGEDVVEDICNKKDIDLICRAHEVVEQGYEFFAGQKLVTLFSAPNYCGQFDNKGVVMTITEDLLCSFFCIHPRTKRVKTKGD